jgi:calcineurin-like phosphoesterase family protein
MTQKWLISDTHWGHQEWASVYQEQGNLIRPFGNLDVMDNELDRRWRERVSESDTVYHLGDITLDDRHLWHLRGLPGHKILIRGNHDQAPLSAYLEIFRDIQCAWVSYQAQVILTHMPVHPTAIPQGWVNVHGHIHQNRIRLEDNSIDVRYYNVCVEHHDFAPLSWDQMLADTQDARC